MHVCVSVCLCVYVQGCVREFFKDHLCRELPGHGVSSLHIHVWQDSTGNAAWVFTVRRA
eukprot:m.330402 g.330402  ORF g.330402 m.330402 type:complete len:59 (-) comp20460_c1_seq7:1634-1810(-)